MKADIQKILLTGEDRPDLYSVHRLVDVAPMVKPQIVAEIHGKPINYLDGSMYAPCDLALIEEQNWEFEYAVKKNNFRAYFNDWTDPQNPTLASFEIINSQGVARWINYKMHGITGASQGISDGNTITYQDVFPGVNLQYVVDIWRLKEDIIIKQPVEHYGYKFTLKLDSNVILEQQEDGSIDFIDAETDERLWGIAKPYAKDADGKESQNVRYIIGKETYNGIEYDSIEVVIEDTEFIENVVFPIVIDPTTITFTGASMDGMAQVEYATVYGETQDKLFAYNAKTYPVQTQKNTGYVTTVGLFRLNTASLPDGITVSDAKLQLYVNSKVDKDNRNFVVEYYNYGATPTTSAFTFTVSNNAHAGTDITNIPTQQYSDFTLQNLGNINLTGYTSFRSHISGGAPTVGSNFIKFDAYGMANPYKLLVTYNIAPTVTAPNGGETYNASTTITWSASTDADGDSLTYHLQYSPNNGANWYDIATGRTGTSYVWNTSALTAGSTYLVRIRAYDGVAYSSYDQSNGVFTIQHNQTPTAPTSLLIEGATNPTYVLDVTPEFSAIFNDPDTGDTTTKVEIQVGTTDGAYDMWNSGIKTITSTAKGARCPDISYAGTSLASNTLYYVQLRFTDAAGAVSAWVKGQFTMGWLHKLMGVTPSKVGGVQPKKILGLQ